MHAKRFGNTDISTSELGLGCARIGGIFQNDPRSFVRLLQAALDEGIRFFDTADMYSQGESETLLGRAFQGRRHELVIASKAGYCLPARRRWIARVKPFVRPLIKALGLRRDKLPGGVRGALAQDFSPAYLRSAVEGSLRRLRTDYLDLLQLHSPPAEIVAAGEWVSALEELKRAGKIRYYGVSCDTVEAAEAALRFADVASLQVAVNLLDKRFVERILPAAKERGVAVIARECLANGLLVKPLAELNLANHWPTPAEERAGRAELEACTARAAQAGVPLAKLALDFVAGLAPVSVTLIGVSRVEQLHTTLRIYGQGPNPS